MALTGVSNSTVTVEETGASKRAAMAVVTSLFFVWGFLTCLNDILIPHLRTIFDLNFAEVMLVQFVWFTGYAVFAIPAGKLVERIGYKPTMVIGLLTMATGALLFLPAASVPAFSYFLAALIVVSAGITALQVSANPYVAILGPPATASSRLNLAQAFNSLGTTIAPYFGSVLILTAATMTPEAVKQLPPAAFQAYRITQASSVKMPYLFIALTLVILALVIFFFKLPRIRTGTDKVADAANTDQPLDSIWRHRNLVLGVVGIFVYVGAEVAIGSFLVNYLSLPEIGGMSQQSAAKYVSFYWGFAMIGRFAGAAILQKVQAGKLLGLVAVVAGALVLLSMSSFGSLAMWSIIFVGLFNSVMFPSIFTLGIAGLGPLTGRASGLLVTAIVGGAVLPELEGLLADRIGIHHAFIIPVLCYIFIAYYGFKGSKARTATAEA
ncbi:MAG TPA: sugar MFS transporter [Bryobacteraceae bacterium]|nr:sugar MFS transporter [Bryobacteraceae bacterium]